MAGSAIAPRPGIAYAIWLPLAALAILIWLPADQHVRVIAVFFALVSALLLWVFPRELSFAGYDWRRWAAALLVAFVAVAVGQHLPLVAVLITLLVLWLLRLWYIRQYYRRLQFQGQADADLVELMRRCLLLALWSHLSVLTALLSPY